MGHVNLVYQLLQPSLVPRLLLFVPVLLTLLHLASRSRHGGSNTKQKQPKHIPPPSPPALPIIGHLHLIGDLPHVSLRSLAAKHGGLMLLRLGTVPNLVVSSSRAARLIMQTHDHAFASRPASKISDTLLYGSSDIAFAPYGEHWRQIRRLVTTHLFTVKKVNSYRLSRQEEVRLVMDKIREAAAASKEVDISEMMNTFANDIVCRAVSGKFFRAEGRNKLFRKLIEMNAILFGGFNLEDNFPGLANALGSLTRWSVSNKINESHKIWDDLLETIISDHERRRSEHAHGGGCGGVDQESDFIDVLLTVQQEYGITRDHIKAILLDMFSAGTETSSIVLELAMAELMRHPQLMSKLQAEVRKNTPKGQEMVEQDNLASMPYLRAVVKETLRLHPPAPLLLPHLSMVDCDVDGYRIPSGTRVIINGWAISRDPESWGERAEEFMPERFMEAASAAAIDMRGNDFQFVPFGAGRRICPGLNFGLATVEIMLANLVYCFDWGLPIGMKEEDIDMTEVFGLSVRRKEKLILLPEPRAHGTVVPTHQSDE